MRSAIVIVAALLAAPVGAIAADAVQPAVPLDRPAADYPDNAGSAEGAVKLSFKIGADGHVHDAAVIESNPKGVFDSAALTAISGWTYRPRTINGRPVEQPDNGILLRFKPGAPAPVRAIVYAPAPYYPEVAYLTKAEGTVVVEFDVTADGNTTNVRAVEATTPGLFDQVAVDTVNAAIFEPLTDANGPSVHLRRRVEFTMANARVKAHPNKINPPLYPPLAEDVGLEGICDVNLTIRTDGTVKDPKIELCYPKGVFDQVSLDAIKTWTFFPVRGPNGVEESRAFYRFSYKIQGVQDRNYLKPHQWIRLRYTLAENGTAKDVQVVATSEPGLPTRHAVEQLRNTQFEPAIEDGKPVEKPGREIRIVGR